MTRHVEKNIHAWTSKEDQEHFRSLIDEHDALVMGTGTYDIAKTSIRHKPKKLRIVLTHHPERYKNQEIKNQLEFHTLSPSELVSMLTDRGHKKLLVVGGGRMITEFLRDGLVDFLYITVEPKIFGTGNPMIATEDLDIELQLIKNAVLNKQGTILLEYKTK
jgi:dihydrofolate reductase